MLPDINAFKMPLDAITGTAESFPEVVLLNMKDKAGAGGSASNASACT
jgi:hypothetical protein